MGNSDELRVGDIITVIADNLRFTGKQGRVEKFFSDGHTDGPIGVRFPHYYRGLFDYGGVDNIVRFQFEELRKNNRDDRQDITQEKICDILFGSNMWHTILLIDKPLLIGFSECMFQQCEKNAITLILFNCHGVVHEAHACQDHMRYHACNTDEPMIKKVDFCVNTDKLLRAVLD